MVSEDVPHPHLGGLGKHALNLSTELHRRGHEVDMLGNAQHEIARYPEQSGPGRFFADIRGHTRGWKETRVGAFVPWRTWLSAHQLAGSILHHAPGYDVVHYHGHLPWVGARIPPEVPFVQTRHDQGGDCMLKTRYKPVDGRCSALDPAACASCATARPNVLQRRLSRYTVRDMRQRTAQGYRRHPVIFVSAFLQSAFSRVSGGGLQGTVIHNAVDVAALNSALAAPPVAGRDGGVIEFFSAGAMFEYKGYGQLLSALQQHPLPRGSRLTIAGDGPLLLALRAAHESAQVRFLGWTDYAKVITQAASADAVIVPSACEEPCSTAVLEALALGKTVLASASGGTPELLRYRLPAAGELRLFDSPAAMAQAMSGFSPQPAAAKVAHQVAPSFSGTIGAMTDAVLDVYRSVQRAG